MCYKQLDWSNRKDISTWVEANDDQITFEEEPYILRKEAYMLFYERF